MSRKQRFNEVVEKYSEEITTLSKLDLNNNHSREKVKIFVWTKIKTEINYSPATYYLDIFLNIKKAHRRKGLKDKKNKAIGVKFFTGDTILV